jgi:hypothetical protein
LTIIIPATNENPEHTVNENLMILPADEPANIRLIQIPDDFEQHEAYRYVTGLIAKVEENQDYTWEDILDLLEERGFEAVDFMLGPSLD